MDQEGTPQEQSIAVEEPAAAARVAESGYTPRYSTPGRRPAEVRPGAFNVLAWLVEGASGLVEEARHNDLGLKEEFWIHFYAAQREGLLAARALLDSVLERVDKDAAQAERSEQQRARRGGIDVSF